jgi:hypothetical protein
VSGTGRGGPGWVDVDVGVSCLSPSPSSTPGRIFPFLGSVWHSCKKLQASVKACPEITQFAVFVHIINPTGFFVYDFDCFSRSKSTYRRTDGKRMNSVQHGHNAGATYSIVCFYGQYEIACVSCNKLQCAVQRRGSSVGETPTRQLVAPAGSSRSGERR